jgi:predicted hotdog family 3-hydroxylacyl-ACP dehydratase
MSAQDEILALVPHRRPLLLIDTVVERGPTHLVVRTEVRPARWSPCGLPSYVAIEMIAQAIAAFETSRSPRDDGKPAIGVLLGTRLCKSAKAHLPAGAQLRIRVEERMSDPSGFGAFQGTVSADTGEVLVEALVKVYRPEDFWAYLSTSPQS